MREDKINAGLDLARRILAENSNRKTSLTSLVESCLAPRNELQRELLARIRARYIDVCSKYNGSDDKS
jgi:hypothetical protein